MNSYHRSIGDDGSDVINIGKQSKGPRTVPLGIPNLARADSE